MISTRLLFPAIVVLFFSGIGFDGLPTARGAVGQSAASQRPPAARHNEGKTLFEGNCAVCHGIDGGGGTGPRIRELAVQLGPSGVIKILRGGVLGSGMPSFQRLGDRRLNLIANYIVSLGEAGGGVVTGNAEEGKEVYESSGCASCHMIAGKGGDSGPDLTEIGSQRAVTMLRNAVVNPGTKLPKESGLAERSQFTAYVMERAVTKDGHVITGMRVDEDSFTIQLRDAKGEIHSLNKAQLRSLKVEPGVSVMPSVKGKLTGQQINDLVAYLAGLKGAQ